MHSNIFSNTFEKKSLICLQAARTTKQRYSDNTAYILYRSLVSPHLEFTVHAVTVPTRAQLIIAQTIQKLLPPMIVRKSGEMLPNEPREIR